MWYCVNTWVTYYLININICVLCANAVTDEVLQYASAVIQQTQPQLGHQRWRCGNCGSIYHISRSDQLSAKNVGTVVSLIISQVGADQRPVQLYLHHHSPRQK